MSRVWHFAAKSLNFCVFWDFRAKIRLLKANIIIILNVFFSCILKCAVRTFLAQDFFCRISPRNAGPRFSGRGPLIVPAALTGRVSRCRRESRAVRVVFGLWHTASYESSRKEFFRNVYKIAAMLGTLGDKCQGSE